MQTIYFESVTRLDTHACTVTTMWFPIKSLECKCIGHLPDFDPNLLYVTDVTGMLIALYDHLYKLLSFYSIAFIWPMWFVQSKLVPTLCTKVSW